MLTPLHQEKGLCFLHLNLGLCEFDRREAASLPGEKKLAFFLGTPAHSPATMHTGEHMERPRGEE